ncbi:hypothetical protein BS78_05G233100 [Paspalum vaginatum]|nr:hypothetical protein BS78_05G233100 [Paspalum vaginatum]
MADLFSIIISIIKLAVNVKKAVDTVGSNREECRRIRRLVATVRTVVEGMMKRTPKAMEDEGMVQSLRGLEDALERSLELVVACQKMNVLRGGIEAGDVADKLRQVYQDISTNLILVNLAGEICNASALTDIKQAVDDLCAKDAKASKLDKVLEIVAAHPDARLRRKVRICVATDHNPTEHASGQNKKKKGAKKIRHLVSLHGNYRAKDKSVKDNAPVGSKEPHASLSYGPPMSTPTRSVIGQGGPIIVNKISRSTENMSRVTSMDMHPAKPWIVTGHKEGFVSIWHYKKQQTVMKRQIPSVPNDFANLKHKCSHCVSSVKFISEKEWLVVGGGDGYIRLYSYKGTNKLQRVDKFRADHGESVDSLAVHPTKKYLLSSSAYGRKINLWDWSNGCWEQIHEFDIASTYPDGVLSLKFNPRGTDTFACVTDDKRIQVGNIESFSLTAELEGQSFKAADYFCTRSLRNLMVTLRSTSPDAEIRDLKTGEVVGTLGVRGHKTRRVASHPTLPILVTALDNGTICFWDANTYSLRKKVRTRGSSIRHLALFAGTSDVARLAVTFKSTISIMEINLPRGNTSG